MRTLLLLLVASVPPTPLAEGEILEIQLEASLDASSSAEARVRYRLELGAAEAELPVSFLEIDGARVDGVEAEQDSRAVTVRLDPGSSRRRGGRIDLARHGGGPAELTIRYRVTGALARRGESLVARLPLPILGSSQSAARPRAFSARVVLPEGYELVEGFPAGFSSSSPGTAAVTLPLVPAFVTVRASTNPGVLTFSRAVDAGAVLLLSGLGAFGLYRLRGSRT